MAPIMLIGGLILLVVAGDALVRGAVSAAQRLHIPPIIIGLTIVAFGTSAPELVVSLEAALRGAPGLAIGNAVGSNIANTLLVLGAPAIIAPLLISDGGVRRSATFMVATCMLLVFMSLDGTLTRLDGVILFVLLVIYLSYSAFSANKARRGQDRTLTPEEEDGCLTGTKAGIFIVFGIVGLGLGGKLTTLGALGIATMLGIENSAVGLTIVALGTSLPELVTSISAAVRRQTGVIIGNVLGSNIFNTLGILGITSMVVPLSVSSHIASFDIWVMLAAVLLILPLAYFTRRLNRIEGLVMTIAYLVYTISVFMPWSVG